MHLQLFQILAVLRSGPADSAGVLAELRRLAESADVPSIPGFYRHLRKGMDEGWLEIVEGEPADEGRGRGRPRRVYALTPAGSRALKERARGLSSFTRLAFEGPEAGAGKRGAGRGGRS